LVDDSPIVLKPIVRPINHIGQEIDPGLYPGNADQPTWVEEWYIDGFDFSAYRVIKVVDTCSWSKTGYFKWLEEARCTGTSYSNVNIKTGFIGDAVSHYERKYEEMWKYECARVYRDEFDVFITRIVYERRLVMHRGVKKWDWYESKSAWDRFNDEIQAMWIEQDQRNKMPLPPDVVNQVDTMIRDFANEVQGKGSSATISNPDSISPNPAPGDDGVTVYDPQGSAYDPVIVDGGELRSGSESPELPDIRIKEQVRDEPAFVLGIDEPTTVPNDVNVWDNSNSPPSGDSSVSGGGEDYFRQVSAYDRSHPDDNAIIDYVVDNPKISEPESYSMIDWTGRATVNPDRGPFRTIKVESLTEQEVKELNKLVNSLTDFNVSRSGDRLKGAYWSEIRSKFAGYPGFLAAVQSVYANEFRNNNNPIIYFRGD